jgi:hypothetical protein
VKGSKVANCDFETTPLSSMCWYAFLVVLSCKRRGGHRTAETRRGDRRLMWPLSWGIFCLVQFIVERIQSGFYFSFILGGVILGPRMQA